MARLLLLFAHPLLEKSRVHKRLIEAAGKIPGIFIHDLYEAYPDFEIDVEAEKELLMAHDVIILQHPVYWYSAPPVVRQWQDLVLQYGWAYGKGGFALKDKRVLQVVSAGGPSTAYGPEGRNRYTVREFLIPFEQTFRLCHMEYLPPLVIHGTHRLGIDDINRAAGSYGDFLDAIRNDALTPGHIGQRTYFDLLTDPLPLNLEKHEQ